MCVASSLVDPSLALQISLSAQLGFRTEPYYEAPSELQVKYEMAKMISIGWVRLSTEKWPKVASGGAK